jgi:hypothetical protein
MEHYILMIFFGDDGKTECSTELGMETSYRELGRLRESGWGER